MSGWIKYGDNISINLDNLCGVDHHLYRDCSCYNFISARIIFYTQSESASWEFSDEQEFKAVLAEVHRLIDAEVISINPE